MTPSPSDDLRAALSAWRKSREPRLADVIDRISERITATIPPIREKSVGATNEAWEKMAAKRDPTLLGRLLATPWPKLRASGQSRLKLLDAFAPDPRLAVALADLLRTSAYPSRQVFALMAGKRVLASADPRTLPAMIEMVPGLRATWAEALASRSLKGMRELTDPDALASLLVAQPLTPAHARLLLDFERRYPPAPPIDDPATDDSLLAAIWADPDDDTPRLVYADLLAQRGDPRGEFIALQCERAAGRGTKAALKREKALWKEHGARWIRELPLSPRMRPVYERGFLASCLLDWRKGDLDRLLAEPGWATLRACEIYDQADAGDLFDRLDHPSLRGLRSLSVPEGSPTGRIEGVGHPGIEEFALFWSGVAAPGLRGLPGLRRLTLTLRGPEGSEAEGPRAAAGSPWWDEVEELTILREHPPAVARWLRLLKRHPPAALRVFRLQGPSGFGEPPWAIRVTRDDAGALSLLSWDEDLAGSPEPAGFIDRLARHLGSPR